MQSFYLAAACAATVAVCAASAAGADPVYTSINADLSQSPVTITYQGGSFTFDASGDFFSPLALSTNDTGAVSAFGGFLGIPLQPSPSFVDRGTVVYGPDFGQFASFLNTTTVPYSNGDNFIGLRAAVGDDFYYGFVFTNNSTLVGYGFETLANTAITATTNLAAPGAVPEPGTWGLMIVGFGIVGGAMRRRSTNVTYAT